MVSEKNIFKVFPIQAYGSYMLPWQLEFQSNQLQNLKQPSTLLEGGFNEIWSELTNCL